MLSLHHIKIVQFAHSRAEADMIFIAQLTVSKQDKFMLVKCLLHLT